MAWGKNGTPDTLTVAGVNMNIPDMTGKVFNVILNNSIQDAGEFQARTTINDDNAPLYSNNRATNGLANQTIADQTNWFYGTNLNTQVTYFTITYLIGAVGQEKLMQSWYVDISAVGVGSTPERIEFVGKYSPNPDATINRIDEFSETADYGIGSNKSALGTD